MSRPAGMVLWAAMACCAAARAQGPVPVGELFPSDANGQKTLQLAGSGMSVVSGSDLAAGIAPATFKLYRGGEVRICPHSALNVMAGGRGLTLATGVGSMEVEYELTQDSADLVITPDFNITLAGPGKFHFALGISKNGNTCVKPLTGNAAEIAFAELLGTGSYKSKADEAVLFLTGKLDQHSDFTGECGCPAPAPVLRASAAPPAPTPAPEKPAESKPVSAGSSDGPAPAEHPSPVRVEVDTPFIFSAKPSADRPYAVARIQVSTLPNVIFVQERVDPIVLAVKPAKVSSKAQAQAQAPPKPATPPKQEKKGFLGRIKGFFGSMFHR